MSLEKDTEIMVHINKEGKDIQVKTRPSESSDEFMKKIANLFCVHPSEIKIRCGKQQLQAGYTVGKFGIKNGSKIEITVRTRGGM